MEGSTDRVSRVETCAGVSTKNPAEGQGRVESNSRRSSLIKIFEDDKLANLRDLVVVVEGEECFAHKVVLAGASPVFAAMFTNGMKETNPDQYPQRIELLEVSLRSWRMLLHFLYYDWVTIEDDGSAHELIEVAQKYDFHDLVESLDVCLRNRITASNALDFWNCGKRYELDRVCDKCFKCLEENFEAIHSSLDYEKCTEELLLKLLHSDDMTITSESVLVDSVLLWIRADEKKREKQLESMLKCVRVERMSPLELIAVGISVAQCKQIPSFTIAVMKAMLENGSGALLWGVFQNPSYLIPCPRYERPFVLTQTMLEIDQTKNNLKKQYHDSEGSINGQSVKHPKHNIMLRFQLRIKRESERNGFGASLYLVLRSLEGVDLRTALTSVSYCLFSVDPKGGIKQVRTRKTGQLEQVSEFPREYCVSLYSTRLLGNLLSDFQASSTSGSVFTVGINIVFSN